MTDPIGSNFDDFLAEQGMLEEVSAAPSSASSPGRLPKPWPLRKSAKRRWPCECTPAVPLWIVRWIRMMLE